MQALVHVATLARLAAIAAALALVALLGIRPAVDDGASGVRAMGALPACRYDDILTAPRRYADWRITLVDTILRIPSTYAPPDLVRVADLGVPGRGRVRAVMAEDLKAMSDAAAAAGNAIGVHSAYRSYADQQDVFASWVAQMGRKEALKVSARPGHSEHQLGLTIDFRSDPPVATLSGSWGATPAGKWMRRHAWEYGFLMSYPKGKSSLTCYSYEPWHFRYVGRDLAATIHASGLTVREYLWANYTTAHVPAATAKPAPASAEPSATPEATATPVPPSAVPSPAPTAPVVTAGPATPAPPTEVPAAPVASMPTAPPSSPVALTGGAPLFLAVAGIALGTIVLGAVLVASRRGRSGVGLSG